MSLNRTLARRRDAHDRVGMAMRYGALPAALLFCWLAFLAFATVLNPDEAAYRIVETGIFDGKWPYRDLFINRQPLMLLWYVPTGLGASIRAEGLLAAAMIAGSVPVVALLAGRWLSPRHSPIAAATYALLMANPFLTLRANVEAFMLLPLAGALAAPSPALAGAFFGVAVATKFHALVFAPVLLVVWRRQSHIVFLAAAGVCIAVSLPFVFVWRDYWDANVTFALAYGRYTAGDRLASLLTVQWPLVIATLPLWIAAGVAACMHRTRVLIVWAACGALSIKASGYNYAHYYALLMPPLAILAADGVVLIRQHPAPRALLAASGVLAVVLCGFAVATIVRPPHANGNEVLGEAAARTAGETYVLGDRSDIYAYAGRQPQRRFFSSIPLVMIPNWGDTAKADLLGCPPAVLVVPKSQDFPVAWADELERLYGTRADYPSGAVFTNPLRACAPSRS